MTFSKDVINYLKITARKYLREKRLTNLKKIKIWLGHNKNVLVVYIAILSINIRTH